MSIESLSIESSPIDKINIEFSFSKTIKMSCRFPILILSPHATMFRPWASIFAGTPWISHFDELMGKWTIIIEKLNITNDSVSVTRNHIVMTDIASCGHWVRFGFVINSVCNNIPKLSITNWIRVVGRYRHTCNCSKSLSWSTTTKLGVVHVQFSESFLHKN